MEMRHRLWFCSLKEFHLEVRVLWFEMRLLTGVEKPPVGGDRLKLEGRNLQLEVRLIGHETSKLR